MKIRFSAALIALAAACPALAAPPANFDAARRGASPRVGDPGHRDRDRREWQDRRLREAMACAS